MITPTSKQDILDKILNSSKFSNSKIHKAYLTYLVDATANGKELKETTIAIEVFGKDDTFNPAEDTIVRSHTYNLRKKLDSYYRSEGRRDKYRLELPKGHYEAKFIRVADGETITSGVLLDFLKERYQVIAIVLLLVSVAVLLLLNHLLRADLQKYEIIEKDDPIWGNYLQSRLPVLIVSGDHYLFNEYSEEFQQTISIRHPKINSPEDFEALQLAHPDLKLEPTEEPYFPYHSIWSIPPILSLFFSANEKPILRKSSSLSPQMLDEYNIIFLGSIKTLYILKHILSKSHIGFQISPHKITYLPTDSTASRSFETSLHSTGPNDDLVVAAKLPGPAKNAIFIIASFHSLGAPEVAKYLVDPITRTKFEDLFISKFKKMPQYFEAVFHVTGIDKTAYNTEVLIYNQIEG